ncbi:MAG: hypothetical protein FJ290_31670, partial [Planctomycetes bacterium]|nr:hypothetical protein [Planctomycetota bacterium]
PDANLPAPPFQKDAKTYASDDLYPAGHIVSKSVGHFRNQRILSVVVTPVRVRPKSREALVAEHLEIEVSFEKKGEQGKERQDDAGASPQAEYLPMGFSNGVPSKYMVLMDNQYQANATLAEFIGWKKRKGYDVRVVRTSDIDAGGAPTHTQIVNYMRALPAADYPEYLLIIGDHTAASGVQGYYFSTSQGGWSDLYIACRDALDYFPDLYPGRLPATNNTSLSSMLTKVMAMDRSPPSSAMYQRVLVAGQIQDSDHNNVADRLFCETADSLACHFEQDAGGVDYECWRAVVNPDGVTSACQWSPDSILWNSGNQIGTRVYNHFVSTTEARSRIQQRLNAGICLLQHRDHGDVDGWGDPPYSTSDVNALTNGTNRPLVLSINCLTGAYHSQNNFMRAWMQHPNGGAYAVFAAVDVSFSWCNDWLTHGLYAGWLPNYISWHNASVAPDWPKNLPDPSGVYGAVGSAIRLGQMMNFGKMYMFEHNDFNPSGHEDTFRMFHVFGDPESFAQLLTPQPLNVTHDSVVGQGPATISIDAGESDCQICLYSASLGVHAVTNSGVTGEVSFDINTANTGTVYVTVSKFGRRPYEGSIAVSGGIVEFGAAAYEVLENAGSLLVTVWRQGDTSIPSSVDYWTSNGTAQAGADYVAVSGTLSYAAGVVSNSFTVNILNDGDDESGETFHLTLGSCSSNTFLGDPAKAVALIEDDDGAGDLSFETAAPVVAENDSAVTVNVRRRNGSAGQVTVDFATSDGSALAGADYAATNGTLVLADAVKSAFFSVAVMDDLQDEADETVNLALSNPTGGAALASPSNVVLTILDNDTAGSLAFESASYSVNETDPYVTLRIVRTGGSDGVVSVDFSTSNGTAVAGSDYVATNGTLTLAHGVTNAVLTVAILNDSLTEDPETFTVRLANATGGATIVSPSSASVTISSEDGVIWSESLDANPGWTCQGQWAFGQP